MNPEVHPAAMLFPMMNEEELKKLAEDIEDNGLIEPVVLYHGQILDGRNRLAACELAGVIPHFTEVDGDSPTIYVLSKNLHRRHLTISQRGAIAAEVVPMLQEEAKKRRATFGTANLNNQQHAQLSPNGDDCKGGSAELAAKALQVGEGTVQRALVVKREDPETFQRVKRGEITVGEAARKLLKPAVVPDEPYKPTSPTQIKRAEGQKQRMITALSTITGLCRGLSELNMPVALSVCAEEERATWVERSRELAKQLRAFAAKLEETACQQQPN